MATSQNPPRPTSALVAAVVEAALTEAGVTTLQASTQTGIPRTSLQRRLDGHAPFDVDQLAALGSLVGLTITDIFARSEQAA